MISGILLDFGKSDTSDHSSSEVDPHPVEWIFVKMMHQDDAYRTGHFKVHLCQISQGTGIHKSRIWSVNSIKCVSSFGKAYLWLPTFVGKCTTASQEFEEKTFAAQWKKPQNWQMFPAIRTRWSQPLILKLQQAIPVWQFLKIVTSHPFFFFAMQSQGWCTSNGNDGIHELKELEKLKSWRIWVFEPPGNYKNYHCSRSP